MGIDRWVGARLARVVLAGCVVALVAVSAAASPAAADSNEAALDTLSARQLSAGGGHTCMILANGTVRCWGRALEGQLGYGNTNDIGDNETPASVGTVDLGPGRTAREISAGFHHTCVILDDRSVKCWGDSSNGELGYGNTNRIGDDETPASVGTVDLGVNNVAVAIAAGRSHTCAILDNTSTGVIDGTLRCWGRNQFFQLGFTGDDDTDRGNGPIGDDETPGSVPPLNLGVGRTVRAVTAGGDHTCVIMDDRTVRCWGQPANGRLGYGNDAHVGAVGNPQPHNVGPVNLGAGRTARAITAGAHHTCAILDNFAVRCWGEGRHGALGYAGRRGTGFLSIPAPDIGDDEVPASKGPVDLGAGRTARAISADTFHTCAILDNSQVRCWGEGQNGRLGYGNTTTIGDNEVPGSVGPVALRAGRTAVAITTAEAHSCARMSDATLFCWGDNFRGELGLGHRRDIGDNETPASAGPVSVGQQPAVSVTVTADQTAVSVGSGIDYHVTVTNTGALALTGVAVTDPAVPGCAQPVPDLGIGESFTVDCTYTTTPADVGTYVNTAMVDTDQTDPVASAPAEVAVSDDGTPAVAVSVTADGEVVESGGDVGYHLTIANRGNVALTGVVVTDPTATACEQPVPDLGVGERFGIDCVRTTGADDIGTLTNVATVDTDQTDPVASVGVDVRVTPAFQPDLTVRKASGVAIGNGVYNRDGVGQTRTSRRAPGQTAVFYVPVTNDGQGADSFDVRPVGAHQGLSVRYFSERFAREITDTVAAGTFRTVELAPGQTTIIRVDVTVNPTAARGTTPAVTLRARSHTTPSKLDTVNAVVQVL